MATHKLKKLGSQQSSPVMPCETHFKKLWKDFNDFYVQMIEGKSKLIK